MSGGPFGVGDTFTTSTSSGVINTVFSTNPSTTLLINTPAGTFANGDTLNNGTVMSYTSQDGYLLMKSITGAFEFGDIIQDQHTFATATWQSQSNQTIAGHTSDATANVSLDTGSSLVLTDVIGDFNIGETIVSNYSTSAIVDSFSVFSIGETITVSGGATGVIVSDNGSEMVVNMVTAPNFEINNTISDGVSTAHLTNVSNPTMIIIPVVAGKSESNWVFVSTPLTSSTSTILGPFITNLTASQSLLQAGDQIVVSEVTTDFNVTQLYYPENIVEITLPRCKYNKYDVGSAFPSLSPISEPYYIVSTQDFESTSSLWSPVSSLVIGTTLLKVRNEYNGTPITIGQGNLGGNSTSAGFQQAILEIPLEVLPQTGWRGLLFYEPKIETLSSLELSKESLKDLDFQIYWRNRLTNTLTPLTLYNGGSANIRLLFKRIAE